jgi:hypothetical protein
MNYEKLNGIWKGSYKYGNSYPEEYRNKEEAFSLDIRFDGVNFKGVCEDLYTNTLFKKPAIVEGTFVPNLISFIKKYPALLNVDENFLTVIVPDKASLDIHYTGFYYKALFSKTMRFEGEWSMTDFFLDENGKKVFFTSHGTWKMKK